MPELSTLLMFTGAALVLIVIPGPNAIYVVAVSLAQGQRAGLASAVGISTGTLVHVAATAVGLSALLASSAIALNTITYLGAGYLLVLAVQTLAAGQQAAVAAHQPVRRLRRILLQGALVNVLNPKVALFFLAFLPQFIDPTRGGAVVQVLVLGGVFSALSLGGAALYALAGSTLSERLHHRTGIGDTKRYVTASIYFVLGIAAAMAGMDIG